MTAMLFNGIGFQSIVAKLDREGRLLRLLFVNGALRCLLNSPRCLLWSVASVHSRALSHSKFHLSKRSGDIGSCRARGFDVHDLMFI